MKRCVFQLPDRPDGEEQRLTGFSGDPAVDGDRRDASGFEPASRMPEDRAVPQEQASVKSVKEEAAEEKPEPRIDQSDEEALQNFAAQSGKTVNNMTDGTSESSDETHESSESLSRMQLLITARVRQVQRQRHLRSSRREQLRAEFRRERRRVVQTALASEEDRHTAHASSTRRAGDGMRHLRENSMAARDTDTGRRRRRRRDVLIWPG